MFKQTCMSPTVPLADRSPVAVVVVVVVAVVAVVAVVVVVVVAIVVAPAAVVVVVVVSPRSPPGDTPSQSKGVKRAWEASYCYYYPETPYYGRKDFPYYRKESFTIE